MQSSSQIVTTNNSTSNFLQAGCLPVGQPTVSEHWRETIFFQIWLDCRWKLLQAAVLLIMFLVICFLSEYKEKIGLKCQFLIEPKAKEPMKHQYDYGAALFVDVCYISVCRSKRVTVVELRWGPRGPGPPERPGGPRETSALREFKGL